MRTRNTNLQGRFFKSITVQKFWWRYLKGTAIAAIFLGTAFAASNLRAESQLSNPGFEDDLTDWTPRMDRGMSSVVAEAARTGVGGLRITDDSDAKGSGLMSLPIEASPEKKYLLSFWMRSVSGDGGVQVVLMFLDYNGKPLQKKMPSVTASNSADWKMWEVSGVAPAETASIAVQIHSINQGTVVADLDDFQITEAPVTPPAPK